MVVWWGKIYMYDFSSEICWKGAIWKTKKRCKLQLQWGGERGNNTMQCKDFCKPKEVA